MAAPGLSFFPSEMVETMDYTPDGGSTTSGITVSIHRHMADQERQYSGDYHMKTAAITVEADDLPATPGLKDTVTFDGVDWNIEAIQPFEKGGKFILEVIRPERMTKKVRQ